MYKTRPASNEIHREVGRAKDLSAHLYVARNFGKIWFACGHHEMKHTE